MNKPVYLGLLIYEISETLIYEFWHDYNKPKNWQNTKLCYMDTNIFVFHIKTADIYENVVDDVEKRFDTSNYEVNRQLLTRMNKKEIRLMKDELEGKIMT